MKPPSPGDKNREVKIKMPGAERVEVVEKLKTAERTNLERRKNIEAEVEEDDKMKSINKSKLKPVKNSVASGAGNNKTQFKSEVKKE